MDYDKELEKLHNNIRETIFEKFWMFDVLVIGNDDVHNAFDTQFEKYISEYSLYTPKIPVWIQWPISWHKVPAISSAEIFLIL